MENNYWISCIPDAVKTASKKVVQEAAEATGELLKKMLLIKLCKKLRTIIIYCLNYIILIIR